MNLGVWELRVACFGWRQFFLDAAGSERPDATRRNVETRQFFPMPSARPSAAAGPAAGHSRRPLKFSPSAPIEISGERRSIFHFQESSDSPVNAQFCDVSLLPSPQLSLIA